MKLYTCGYEIVGANGEIFLGGAKCIDVQRLISTLQTFQYLGYSWI